MKIKRPEIHLKNIQIKSTEIARRLAGALDEIESLCGIHETRLTITNPFICPDIDLDDLDEDGMEGTLREVLKIIEASKEKPE